MGESVETKANGATAPAVVPVPAPAQAPQSTELVRVGFDTERGFVALQRVAQAFASSTLVPEAYQRNVANCIIAIEMAHRMGASPLMVMQNLYLVHGRPSWASQFLIASFNHCGRFTAIRYRWAGENGKASWACTAYATEKATGEEVRGPEVTMVMADKEGWVGKKGSKWVTMPELMLTYRAATFLVRTVAPELTMGLRTVDENEDIYGLAPTEHRAHQPETAKGTAGLKAALKASEATVEAQPTEPAHDPVTGEIHDEGAASPRAVENHDEAGVAQEPATAPVTVTVGNPTGPGNGGAA